MHECCRCNGSSIFGKNEFSFVFLTSEQDTSNSYHLTISSLKSQIYTISDHLVRGTICLISFSILQDLMFGLLQTMRSKALKRLTSQITIYSPVVPFFDMSFGNNLSRTNRRQSERRRARQMMPLMNFGARRRLMLLGSIDLSRDPNRGGMFIWHPIRGNSFQLFVVICTVSYQLVSTSHADASPT